VKRCQAAAPAAGIGSPSPSHSELGEAAGEHHARPRVLAVQAADQLARLACGFARDRAGVDHDDVGLSGRGHDAMPGAVKVP
jgi:hypothetical protein